jgi:hypothetical protein
MEAEPAAPPVSAAAPEAGFRTEAKSAGARASRRGSRTVVAVLALVGIVGVAAAATVYRPAKPVVLPAEESPARPIVLPTPAASSAPQDPLVAPARMLAVKANAPVTRLKIGAELYQYSPPELSWQARIPERLKGNVTIVAESQDGRRVRLEQEFPASELRIEFPPKVERSVPRTKQKSTGLAPIDF